MVAKDGALSGLTVLIVEDEFLIAADAQRIVEDAGATRVLLASSTAAARGFLNDSHSIDVGILDLKLGSEDGLPLAQEFHYRRIPFVVATGFSGDFDQSVGAVVQKPYNDREVVEALMKALEAAKKAASEI